MTIDTAYEKFSLARIHINDQGYDRNGCYWGVGQPLYQATSRLETVSVRAVDRETAKAQIRDLYPGARFYR